MLCGLEKFYLSFNQLCNVRDCLQQRIVQGLSACIQEIRALPAYLPRPPHSLCGEAVALDVGGTNIRSARINITGAVAKLLAGPALDEEGIMRRAEKIGQVSADEFFDKQADLIAKVCSERIVNVGYCFSFPTNTRPGCSATLIKWTKGINIDKVVGTSVGERLRAALLERGRDTICIPVLNDTVASLLSGALIAPECNYHIGLVAGTGTNMAGFFPVSRISKLEAEDRIDWRDEEEMAINLESGNFTPPYLTEYDDLLDGSDLNDNPGSQRFEKAVSGAYLPRLFAGIVGRKVCLQNGFDADAPNVHSGLIAGLRNRDGVVGQAATAVLDRSADLVAAAVAGLIGFYGEGPKEVGILAEGSLFWRTPGYCSRFKRTLSRLIEREVHTRILQCQAGLDANLLGAACSVLSLEKCYSTHNGWGR